MFKDIYNIILESRLNDYVLQLKDQELARNIFSINDPKKQRMIIKWIKNGSIKYPQDMQIIDKVYQIINRKNLDYNKFNNPQQILDQYQQLNDKLDYNPDNQKCFTNKVKLENGVVVYNVQDDIDGLKAVRKAVDYNWGKDANPWCLITYPIQKALKYWKKYNKIQKRICFQNNKLIAFCANDELKIKWWDRNDNDTQNIPIEDVHDDPKVIKEIYQFKNAINDSKESNDPDRLQQIYQKYNNIEYIITYLAVNPNTPFNILQKLSDDNNWWIRCCVANNPNASQKTLQKLSQDKNLSVIQAVLENINVSIKTKNKIQQLNKAINNSLKSKDSNRLQQIYQKYKNINQIKQNLAKNQNTPINILQKLSDNNKYIVRQHVAKNINTPINILQKLSNDENQQVRCYVAFNLNTPINILQKLSNDENQFVRQNIAYNINTPINILQKLSRDDNYWVRCNVIDNVNVSKEILQKLCNDNITRVKQMAENKYKNFV